MPKNVQHNEREIKTESAAGVFIQMRPHTGKLLEDLVIGLHHLPDIIAKDDCKGCLFTTP